MNKTAIIAIGALWTIGLVVMGLWGWRHADAVVSRVGWENRQIGAWAVRCMAVALVAIAQVLLLALVVERVYVRRDAVCAVAKLSAVLVFMVCTASAIALGLAGR
jgi:hypothetical protein